MSIRRFLKRLLNAGINRAGMRVRTLSEIYDRNFLDCGVGYKTNVIVIDALLRSMLLVCIRSTLQDADTVQSCAAARSSIGELLKRLGGSRIANVFRKFDGERSSPGGCEFQSKAVESMQSCLSFKASSLFSSLLEAA